MPSQERHDNEVALVTGASRGIGRAIAVQLAQDGFDLCLVARSREQLEATARRCQMANPKMRTLVLPCDLTRLEEIPRIIDTCVKTLEGVDVLVNNAGMNIQNVCSSASMATWDQELAVNLLAPMQASITSSATLDKYGVGQKRWKTKGLRHWNPVMVVHDARKWPTL